MGVGMEGADGGEAINNHDANFVERWVSERVRLSR